MQVIPVIDLMRGVVVRAKLGERAAYQPIATPLSPTPEPVDVVTGLMRLAPFRTLYVADLDAILERGDNFAVLDRLRARLSGLRAMDRQWRGGPSRVAATERSARRSSAASRSAILALLASERHALLSLDFRGDAFQGPAELLTRPDLWPARVIVMTLARIGGASGPDFSQLAAIRRVAGSREVYAAGGVRDPADLDALQAAGAAGALVASALHDGRISSADLARHAAVTKTLLSPS